MFDESRSHRPDKRAKRKPVGNLPTVKSKRRRSAASSYFKSVIERYQRNKSKTKAISYTINADKSFIVELLEKGVKRKIEIGFEVYCSCNQNNRADRKVCCHIVWVLHEVGKVELDCDILAQVQLTPEELESFTLPAELPLSLKTCDESNDSSSRSFHPKIREHSKFSTVSEWFVGIKNSQASSTCSGCLTKAAVKRGDLHIYTKGILYLQKHDRVVETTCRFCPTKSCVQTMRSSLHNIRPLVELKVKKSPDVALSVEQRMNLQLEGFSIAGLTNIELQ